MPTHDDNGSASNGTERHIKGRADADATSALPMF